VRSRRSQSIAISLATGHVSNISHSTYIVRLGGMAYRIVSWLAISQALTASNASVGIHGYISERAPAGTISLSTASYGCADYVPRLPSQMREGGRGPSRSSGHDMSIPDIISRRPILTGYACPRPTSQGGCQEITMRSSRSSAPPIDLQHST
jgi:hypothetical protein